jgi:L-ascorbate metabolism protein UlaG (beta-lactamase superfamily)
MFDTITLTYVGGPTALLEFGGVRFLTDPTVDPAITEYPIGGEIRIENVSRQHEEQQLAG